jgi:hypothetical protein
MNREVHVRFWESAAVQFHCATHLPPCLRLGQPRQGGARAVHRLLQHRPPAFVAGHEDPRRVLLRDAAGDQTGSMSGEPELPTASVVRSSQATPARRRGQLCTDVRPAGLHLSKPVRCSDNRDHLYPRGAAWFRCSLRIPVANAPGQANVEHGDADRARSHGHARQDDSARPLSKHVQHLGLLD